MPPRDDYYALLNASRGDSQHTIRRRFRKLARELHPDVNPNPEAQERFKIVSEAYEILGDANARRNYNAYLDNHSIAPIRLPTKRERPRRTNLFPWLVLILILIGVAVSGKLKQTLKLPHDHQRRYFRFFAPESSRQIISSNPAAGTERVVNELFACGPITETCERIVTYEDSNGRQTTEHERLWQCVSAGTYPQCRKSDSP